VGLIAGQRQRGASVPLQIRPLHTKDETAREMSRLVDLYAGDLNAFDVGGVPLGSTPLPIFYQAIRAIPYRQDTAGVEVVSRPYILLTAPLAGWDCKKRAIVLASWCKLHNIPYRFVAVSRRASGEIHHVITEAYIDRQWLPLDATYPRNQLFQREAWTNVELLGGEGSPTDQPVLVSLSGDGPPLPGLTWEFTQQLQRSHPEYMGIATEAVVSIVTAIVAAVTAITVAIVSAVSQKKSEERRAATEAATVASYAAVQAQQFEQQQEAAATAAAVAAAEAEKQRQAMQRLMLIGGGLAAAIVLLT